MAVKTTYVANKNPNAVISTTNRPLSAVEQNAIYQATHYGSLGTAAQGQNNNTAKLNGNTINKKVTTGTSSTNKTSSGSGSGSASAVAPPTESYSNGYESGYAEGGGYAEESSSGGGFDYAAMIEEMLERQRAEAQAAYDNSKSRLDQAWANTQSSLKDNLNSALGSLRSNYDYSAQQVNNDASKSLREAYINYMMNKKNLNQNLSAAGISGGATESSMANMYNNYGNSRNSINAQLAENLAKLLNTYQNNVASANQAYNSEQANAMNNYVGNLNNLEGALAQNLISNYSGSSLAGYAGYMNALNNAISSQQSYQYTPTTNNYGVDAVSTQSANNTGSVTDYAKYLAMVQNQAKAGTDSGSIIQNLVNSGASLNDIYSLYGVAK